MFEVELARYLSGLETLPGELQRNFALMKELDTRSQDLINKINDHSEEYVRQAEEFSDAQRTEKLKDINEMFEKTKEYADDKVQLAMQTYEMVDKHIRRLDSELVKLEADLKEKQLSSAGKTTDDVGKKKGRGRAGGEKKSAFNPKNVIKEDLEKKKVEPTLLGAPNVLNVLAGSSEVIDMPVDPNEPTYCLCHQVSYGEMIGCDNPDCPIEWYHFGCVDLITKPKGKWYCPKCTSDRKKK